MEVFGDRTTVGTDRTEREREREKGTAASGRVNRKNRGTDEYADRAAYPVLGSI